MRNDRKRRIFIPSLLIIGGILIIIGDELPLFYRSVGDVGIMLFSFPNIGIPLVILAMLLIGLGIACLRGWRRHWPHYLASILSFLGIALFTFLIVACYHTDSSFIFDPSIDVRYPSVGLGLFFIVAGMLISFLGSTLFIIAEKRRVKSSSSETTKESYCSLQQSDAQQPSPPQS